MCVCVRVHVRVRVRLRVRVRVHVRVRVGWHAGEMDQEVTVEDEVPHFSGHLDLSPRLLDIVVEELGLFCVRRVHLCCRECQ